MTVAMLGASSAALATWCGPTLLPRARLHRAAPSRPVDVPALVTRWRRTVARVVPIARSSGADGEAACAELLSAFAGQLGAGLAPAQAFVRAGDEIGAASREADWLPAVEMVRLGAPGPVALLATVHHPVLRSLAVAWRVTETSGAALGPVTARLADAVRADARHRRSVDAELAGVRASARLLAGLPMVGLLLGELLGASPVSVLFGTDVGRCCLLGAALLEWGGLRWIRAIGHRARSAR